MLPRLRRLWLRLAHAFRSERAEADLAREVAAHLALLEDELVRRGLPRERAYTEARKALGAEAAKHAHRDARSFRWIDELLIDVKYAIRRFRMRPGASVLAIAMLAIAIGLSTAMFTIVDALIVRPLPFPHAERLATIVMFNRNGGRIDVAAPVLDAWRRTPVFDRVEGFATLTAVVDSPGGPLVGEGAIVTPGLLQMLGARPIQGRTFSDSAHEGEVVVSETLWRRAFQSDPGILGRAITLDGTRGIVVGVMPRGFRFPGPDVEFWRSVTVDAGDATQRLRAFVRRADAVPNDDMLRVATEAAHAADPSTEGRVASHRPIVGWASDTYYRRAVPFLAGAVALVALVMCANVGSLLLTRIRARRREFTVCAALGASRGRLLRQTIVETLVTGGLGAAGGVTLAWFFVAIASAILPEAFLASTLNPLDLDERALVVSLLVSVAVTCCAGVVPALATRAEREAGGDLHQRGGTHTRRGHLVVRTLLVTEVALACALLVGATLLVRTFVNVTRIDRGFDPAGMVTLALAFEGAAFPTSDVVAARSMEIERDIRSLPGVQGTAWSGGVPLNAGMISFGELRSDVDGAAPVEIEAEEYVVGGNYFDFYGIPIVAGRPFAHDEREDAAIVGERLAAALWPDMEAVGRSFTSHQGRSLRVVGVARETRRSVMDPDADYADVYRPFQGDGRYLYLSIRCAAVCPSEGVLRQRVAATPAELWGVRHLEEAFARDLEQPRASAVLVGTFALVALVASAGGLFGVLSYAVQERRREFGIRSALGATPARIAKVVFREGAIVGTAGLLLGIALAAALASTLASLSYRMTAFDPVSVIAVVTVLAATILLALWRPARAAARTDPALLLKEE